jgi:3-methyladenine DNA glycosylase AlkD
MKVRSPSSSIPTKRSNPHQDPERLQVWTAAAVLRELQVPEISAPLLHSLAKRIGKDHKLAQELWDTENHEARILATLVAEPRKVTGKLMEKWTRDFDSWGIVDSACCYLFALTDLAWAKAFTWSQRKEEFVKRAAFSLVAYLSYKDKSAPDAQFRKFLEVIEREAWDDRHFVRKAVNWALRNIGKRNAKLNVAAIEAAEKIRTLRSTTAHWIATDALRELKSPAVQARLTRKTRRSLSERGVLHRAGTVRNGDKPGSR